MAYDFLIVFLLLIVIIAESTFSRNVETKEKANFEETWRATTISHEKVLINSGTEAPKKTPDPDSEPATEWGGNCTRKHWIKCSNLTRWVTSYLVDPKKPSLGFKLHETDCLSERPICLKNGYTVTRCQLLCMRCNKEFLSKYDKYVDREGACIS